MSAADTIYAISTGAGGALTVIRVSGPAAHNALERLTGCAPPLARSMGLRQIANPQTSEPIDQGLVVAFGAGASATGEAMAELYLHGGRAVAEATLQALSVCPGLRIADPGEFTRRAFANDILDLTQAEAVADLVVANTPAQLRQAFGQMQGQLGELYEHWRSMLILAMSRYEAEIDFADEDLPTELVDEAIRNVATVVGQIAAHLDDERRGEILRDGFEIALIGPPNAGKSSLLNKIAGRDVAIVSQTAGTTRDVIEVSLNLNGFLVTLLDTAGIRDNLAPQAQQIESVELEGIRRAKVRASAAELAVVVVDCTTAAPEWQLFSDYLQPPNVVVMNKVDLGAGDYGAAKGMPTFQTSAITGAGIDLLIAHLANAVSDKLQTDGAPIITRARHRSALIECKTALEGLAAEQSRLLPEAAAEDLRRATTALGRITGRVDVEDVLGEIFSNFCIGK